ncbi:MAG TPA: phosphatase PAP2 family protein [Bryobacteraceae bacterium]|nr:phosphatase PAP2 family protein [Bryobacteraceae bacterium]
MTKLRSILLAFCTLPLATQAQVEPQAGSWKTWVIASGTEFRVPPPPDTAATRVELDWLRDFSAQTDRRIPDITRFWNAGPPSYRWMEIITDRFLEGRFPGLSGNRAYAYTSMAMYDATVAAWESKYFYNRRRPSQVDSRIKPKVDVPDSPSYPSDYAATAGAAATVLGYFFPDEARRLQELAEEAARSRLFAGVEHPSDYLAGLELGRQIGARVLQRARADGSDVPWTGAVPTGPCMWVGTNPGNVAAISWRPILLSSPAEFRSAPPPPCTSEAVRADLARVREYQRTFTSNYKAFMWQSPDGVQPWPIVRMNRFVLEDNLEANPPRAARAYALVATAGLDAFIASQDAKYTYWYPRPHMVDPAITPVFPVPNFPSYPSNHSAYSTAMGEIVAYLFPTRADSIRATAKEAGDSRIWAGIHFHMDNDAGVVLGRRVAAKFIGRAETDGSQ